MSDSKPVHRRPKILPGATTQFETGCGHLFVTVNHNDVGDPWEIFLKLGKCGNCPAAMLEALGRAISLGLRAGVKASQYMKTLKGIGCQSPTHEEGELIASCIDAAARALQLAIKKEEK